MQLKKNDNFSMHYVLHIKYDPEICISMNNSWMVYTHEGRNDAFPGCMYAVNVNLWFSNISSLSVT